MAKNKHWKKAIRAEVAAALQSQPGATAPTAPVANARSMDAGKMTTPGHTVNSSSQEMALQHTAGELWRIIGVAAILFILLITATVTDHNSHWLDGLATKISNSF